MTSIKYITCKDVDKNTCYLEHLDGAVYNDLISGIKYLLIGNVLVQYDGYTCSVVENQTNCLSNPEPIDASALQSELCTKISGKVKIKEK